MSDPMRGKLEALAATQRALLQKIEMLEQQEAEEDDYYDGPGEDVRNAPRPADEEEDTVAMLMRKQEELQQMRSAISELKGLQTNVQMLLCGGQPAAAPAAEAVESEEDVLRGLLAKRAELQKMQEALASIQGFTGSQYSAQQLPTMEEEEETEEQEEEEGDEQEEDLMEELMRKHAELQRMRSTIFGSGLLDSEQGGASAPRFAPKRAWEEEEQEEEQEEQEEEEEEDDEPTTEEGWVRKLMQQQEQLKQLRAGISAVQNQVEEEEEDEVEEEEAREREMLETLQRKRAELSALLGAKARLEQQLADEQESYDEPAPSPQEMAIDAEVERAMAEDDEEAMEEDDDGDDVFVRPSNSEEAHTLMHILERRRQAQAAVAEQEDKIAELTALQTSLRRRLAMMEAGEEEAEEEEEGEDVDYEHAEAPAAGDEEIEMQARVLELLGRKTRECDELAGAVEHARETGMDLSDPRLHRAEEALAERYAEVKEIAGLAYKLGLAVRDDDEEEDEEEEEEEDDDDDDDDDDDEEKDEDEERAAAEEAEYRAIVSLNPAQRAALDNVRGLESELQACVAELGQVEASSSPAVVRHPAFVRIRADVKGHLEALKVQLEDARELFAYEMSQGRDPAKRRLVSQEEEEEEARPDLRPVMQHTVQRLWERPYDCRLFTLQLLKNLSELDDQSLSMMCSCFSRYIAEHAVQVG